MQADHEPGNGRGEDGCARETRSVELSVNREETRLRKEEREKRKEEERGGKLKRRAMMEKR